MRATQRVIVHRGGGRDPRGNPLPTAQHDIWVYTVSPRSSEEKTPRSDAPLTAAVLRGPWPLDLVSTDKVEVPQGHPQAGMWAINGDVGGFRSFTGWTPGCRVALEKI